MLSYKPIKCSRDIIRFRSILECSYAIYLDSLNIKFWDYEIIWIYYFDGFTGKQRKYICDFRVGHHDGRIENIEVKPLNKQMFTDKYLYAQNFMQNWRWITADEIDKSTQLFSNSPDLVEFPYNITYKVKKFVIWSKSEDLVVPDGFRILAKRKKYENYYQYRIINDNLICDRPKIVHSDHHKNKQGNHGKTIILDLDEILDMVKRDLSLSEISKKLGINCRTVTKFLEDRSYVVRWSGMSNRRNTIHYATKKLWPIGSSSRDKRIRKLLR